MTWWLLLFVALSVVFTGFVYSNRKLRQEKQAERRQHLQDQLDTEKRMREERQKERKLEQLEQERREEERLRLAQERQFQAASAAHKAFLAELIECKGPCVDSHQPRRDFFLTEGRKRIALKEVCSSCFVSLFGENPFETGKRSYPDTLSKLPQCGDCTQDAVGEDSQGNAYCINHMVRHLPLQEVVIK